jgi:hypothetical protein
MQNTLVTFSAPTVYSVEGFDDAIRQLQDAEVEFRAHFKSMRERQRQMVLTRFREGGIISALIDKESGATAVIEELTQRTGIAIAILWDCRRFYLHDTWGQSEPLLEQWLKEQEDSVSWTGIRQYLNGYDAREKNPIAWFASRIEAIERRAMRLDRDALKLEEELDIAAKGEQLLQGKGVVAKAQELAFGALRGDIKDLLELKKEPPRSQDYLKFIRSLPCCVSGVKVDVTAHHVFSHGRSVKCSDYATVPLNMLMHTELHSIGKESFEQKYAVDFWQEIAECLSMYFVGRPLKRK